MLKDYLENCKYVEVVQPIEVVERKQSTVLESLMFFPDFLDRWLQLRHGQITPATAKGYKNIINRIRKYFAPKNTRLSEIKPALIEEYYLHLRNSGAASNTVLHHHVVIRKALDYACKNDLITSNAADKVERPKKEKYRASIYNKEELELLFKAFKDSVIEVPVYIAAMYGLRRSEVLGLKWDAIDFDRKSVEIKHKIIEVYGSSEYAGLFKSDVLKNDSSNRTLPLFGKVEEILLKVKAAKEKDKEYFGDNYIKEYEEYVCVDNMGRLIKPAFLTDVFARTLRANNLKYIRFHDLRHSCASAMLTEGVPMKQIQEWLGHATFSTTADIYSHLDYSSKIESAKKIEQVFDFFGENKKEPDENIIELLSKHGITNINELKKVLEEI